MSEPPSEINPLSDRELLVRFIATRDEALFRQLVERHAALVWSACGRVLRHHQDREDVFQAAFLKLLRHADRGDWRETIGAWLHKVTYRLALKVKRSRVRRRETAILADPWGENCDLEMLQQRNAELALHEAILKLPALDREAITLFYLQRKSQEVAAAELECTPVALQSRLRRGRRRLLADLIRRGCVPMVGFLAWERSQQAVAELVPARIIEGTVFFAGQQLGAGGSCLPVRVSQLARGDMIMMFRSAIATNILATATCYTALCLGGAGLAQKEYASTKLASHLPVLFATQKWAEAHQAEEFLAAADQPRGKFGTASGTKARRGEARGGSPIEDEIDKLIAQLGNEDFRVRKNAA